MFIYMYTYLYIYIYRFTRISHAAPVRMAWAHGAVHARACAGAQRVHVYARTCVIRA